MARLEATLAEVITRMKTGDQVLFGGDSFVGNMIEWYGGCDQCHAATVARGGKLLQVAEAGKHGAVYRPLWYVFQNWEDSWWLPLASPLTEEEEGLLLASADWFVGNQTPYDYAAILSYARGRRPPEDTKKVYCSELSGFLLKETKRYKGTAALMPGEIGEIAIYAQDYYQLSGKPKELKNYNSVSPGELAFAGIAPKLQESFV